MGLGSACEAGVRGDEVAGPRPSLGDAQVGPSGGADDAGGDVQESVAQLLRLRHGVLAVEQQGPGPGEQVDADQGELQPGGVDGEQSGREPAEAGVLAGADPVLDAGVAAVAQFQQLQRAVARGVSVMKTWWRMPSTVSNRLSCAPGWGRSRRTIIRVPSG